METAETQRLWKLYRVTWHTRRESATATWPFEWADVQHELDHATGDVWITWEEWT